jgi:phage baseplate assembly protein V
MSNFLLAELNRRMNNIIRAGTVHAVDLGKARVKVEIGALVTDWLPFPAVAAGKDRTWRAPSVGEQVLVLSPSGEMAAGFVVGSFYTNTNSAPASEDTIVRTTYRDGTVVEYDTSAHRLTATVKGDAVITASGTLAATVAGNVSVQSGATLTLKAASIVLDGPVSASSTITADDDVKAGGISLMKHVHSGVESGTSKTTKPS